MWTIADLVFATVGVLIAWAIVALLVRAFWPEPARYEESEQYPLGDATDTPNVIHMTRRANHERRKA